MELWRYSYDDKIDSRRYCYTYISSIVWQSCDYLWNQTGGRSVELSADNTRSITFESTAGEYSFSLKVTDSYGASDVYERDIKVGPELNESPIADFKAERE